jgi:hypothetical protein
LFPDQHKQQRNNNAALSPALLATLTPAQIAQLPASTLKRTQVVELIRKVYPQKVVPTIATRTGAKPMSLYNYAYYTYGIVWSRLKKDQLCIMLRDVCALPDLPTIPSSSVNPLPILSSSAQETTNEQRVQRKSIMNIYLHAIVSHFADFYEVLDFKNTSTERGEAFLASMKHVVLRFTGRDFTEAHTMREVLIRHCWQARVMPKLRSATTYKKTSSRITKAFNHHEFPETVQFDFSTDTELKEDILALLKHLQDKFEYQSEMHWQIVGQVITFNTLSDTRQTYRYFHQGRQESQSTSN